MVVMVIGGGKKWATYVYMNYEYQSNTITATKITRRLRQGQSSSFVSVPLQADYNEKEILPLIVCKESSGGNAKVESELDDVLDKFKDEDEGKDIELSQDLVLINDQLQQDEVLALESIYGDNVSVLDGKGGLRLLQIQVNIDVPENFIVSQLQSSNVWSVDAGNFQEEDATREDGNSNEFVYTFNVQYLPPITLTCLFPLSYPSHGPPRFTISAQWLNVLKISKLCHKLDSIWTEQFGQEVIYQWIEWLHQSSISYLCFDNGILIKPCDPSVYTDRRAVPGCISPELVIPLLMTYNAEKCNEAFRRNQHVCAICLTEYTGIDFRRLPCKHFFCLACMETYCKLHVKEGTVTKLVCPDAKCAEMIPPELLKCLLGKQAYERWESLLLKKTLDSMCDVVYCPRCQTPCIEYDENNAQCSKCYFSFCTLCNERRHVGVECMSPEAKLNIFQARQNSNRFTAEDQRRKETNLINELKNMKEILGNSKQCPSCKMAISKDGGCNKMVCGNCGQFFCYRCNKAIKGYEHFRSGCELFDIDDILAYEMQMHQHVAPQRLAEFHRRLYVDNGRRCPNCSQNNVKVQNNNHIHCFSCQIHYCFSCGLIVRKKSQHYGPKGCKQHSVDTAR